MYQLRLDSQGVLPLKWRNETRSSSDYICECKPRNNSVCSGKKYISKNKFLTYQASYSWYTPTKTLGIILWITICDVNSFLKLTIYTSVSSVPWLAVPHQGSSLQSANLIESTWISLQYFLLGKHWHQFKSEVGVLVFEENHRREEPLEQGW